MIWDRRLLLIFFVFLSHGIYAQTYLLDATTNGTSINTCSGTLYDNGGAAGIYVNNGTTVITICSDNAAEIILEFTEFDTQGFSTSMSIFDGPSTGDPQVAGSPFSGASGLGQIITSTGTCLTIQFASGFVPNVASTGWAADISCNAGCQDVVGSFQSVTPPINPANGILEICAGTTVNFEAGVDFPENNTDYAQSIATTILGWTFGDGQFGLGPVVSNTFNTPGIYTTSVQIIDVMGCYNNIPLELVVYVSATPEFTGTNVLEPEICLGEENILTGFVNTVPVEVINDCISINDTDAPINATTTVANPLVLPINIDCYNPGVSLTNINDLLGICLNMEHAWVGDIEIEITCPNNQSVALVDYVGFAGLNFDLGAPGAGLDYCFTNTPTYGDLHTDFGGNQPAGSYASMEPLSGLLGCPLNGNWTISIADNFPSIDHGEVFSWEIDFDPSLLPPSDTFEPTIISEGWQADPTITQTVGNQITVLPTAVGNTCYTYEMTDDFNCTHDTTICFNVVPSPGDIVIDPIGNLCNNEAAIVIGATPVGGTWSGDVGAGGTFDPAIGAGSYTGTYTVTGVTCTYSEDVNITVSVPEDGSFTVNDFCVGEVNQATVLGVLGGTFAFNPAPVDGAMIDAATGEITNEVAGASYSVEYTSPGACPGIQVEVVNITLQDNASFTINDICAGSANSATITGTAGGTFSFSPPVADGSTIDPATGEILGGVVGTTYTVQYATTGACADATTEQLTVNAQDDASFTVFNFCVGEVNQATITGTIGGVFSFNPAPGDGATIDPASGAVSDEVAGAIYSIQYDTPGACPDTQIQNVTVTLIDDASFSLPDFCLGAANQATITGAPGGTFDFNPAPADGATINITTGEITGGTLGTIYFVEYTTVGACSNSSIESATVLPPDDASFTLTNFCLNGPNSASGISLPGGTFSFNPVPGDGATIDSGSGEITGGTPGATYDVMYTTAGTCSSSQTQSVSIVDSPIATNIQELCSPDQATFFVTFDIINGDPLSYSVSGAGNLVGSTFTSDPILNGGAYSFEVTDALGCGSSMVDGDHLCLCPATATISGNIDICQGTFGDLTIDFTGDGPWTFTYAIDAFVQFPITTFDNPYSLSVFNGGDYTIIEMSDANCVGPGFGTGVVNETPVATATISGSESICVGENADLPIALTGNGPWDITYALNTATQGTVTSANPNYLLNVTEEGIYTVVAVTSDGCPGSVAGVGEIIINDLPTANISGDIALCDGDPAMMDISLTGAPDFTIGYTLDGVLQDPLTTNLGLLQVLLENEGQYELVSVEDLNCVGVVGGVTNVSIEPLPTASLNGEFTICAGTEQLIPVVLSGAANWTINYMVDSIAQPPLVATANPFVIPATLEGNYQITSVSDNFCSNEGVGEANIYYFAPLTIDYSEDVEICHGDTTDIWAQAQGGISPYSYTWTSPSIVDSIAGAAIVNPLATENIQLTVSDECDYLETFDIPVTVHELPTIAFSALQSHCGASTVQISNNTPINFIDSCVWFVQDDTISECGLLEYYFAEEGAYSIGLSVTSPEGCYSDTIAEEFINIYPQSIAQFSYYPEEITTANPAVSFYSESIDETNVNWTFGDIGTSSQPEVLFDFPVENGPEDFVVCLETDNEYGCADSTCTIVRIRGEIVLTVPNTFTPDEDGLNELFYPVISGIDEDEYTFRIFNRIGNLVFETNDVDDKWNGVPENGEKYYSEDGMYNWQIIARTKGSVDKEEFWGYVILLR